MYFVLIVMFFFLSFSTDVKGCNDFISLVQIKVYLKDWDCRLNETFTVELNQSEVVLHSRYLTAAASDASCQFRVVNPRRSYCSAEHLHCSRSKAKQCVEWRAMFPAHVQHVKKLNMEKKNSQLRMSARNRKKKSNTSRKCKAANYAVCVSWC